MVRWEVGALRRGSSDPARAEARWPLRSRLVLALPATGAKGQACRVLIRGGKNTVLVEFLDGFRVYTSRYAIRKPKGVEQQVRNGRRFRDLDYRP